MAGQLSPLRLRVRRISAKPVPRLLTRLIGFVSCTPPPSVFLSPGFVPRRLGLGDAESLLVKLFAEQLVKPLEPAHHRFLQQEHRTIVTGNVRYSDIPISAAFRPLYTPGIAYTLTVLNLSIGRGVVLVREIGLDSWVMALPRTNKCVMPDALPCTLAVLRRSPPPLNYHGWDD